MISKDKLHRIVGDLHILADHASLAHRFYTSNTGERNYYLHSIQAKLNEICDVLVELKTMKVPLETKKDAEQSGDKDNGKETGHSTPENQGSGGRT